MLTTNPTPLVQVQPRLESQKVNGKSTLPLCNLRRTTALTHPQARLGPHKPSDVQRLRRLAVTAYYVIRVLYANIKVNSPMTGPLNLSIIISSPVQAPLFLVKHFLQLNSIQPGFRITKCFTPGRADVVIMLFGTCASGSSHIGGL